MFSSPIFVLLGLVARLILLVLLLERFWEDYKFRQEQLRETEELDDEDDD